MATYFLRRFLLIIPTFLGITIMVFTITRFVPGGPIERMVAQMRFGGGGAGGGETIESGMGDEAQRAPLTEEQLEHLKEYYGFDKPVVQAYFDWLGKMLVLDLGTSTRYYDPVWTIIKERLPISTFYGIATLILTYLVCIYLGIWKAMYHNSLFDGFSSILVFIGYAIPGFIVGIALMVVFAANLEWFPMSGFMSEEAEELGFFAQAVDVLYHAVLPLIAYMAGSFAVMTIMMKNNLLENLAADYVRTAMAKGISYKKAVFKHAIRNSLIPLATHFGNNISVFLTGSFLIEKVFNIDGFGLLGYESIVERDYPVVMGILAIGAMLQLVGNILSDVCVAIVDPRVQFR